MTSTDIAKAFSEVLKLDKYKLTGVCFSDEKPANALELKKKGNGCIVPLMLKASTGVPLVISEESTGWPCSAFYLGFQDTIFEGIEYFLSHKDDFWRPCERFIQNPALAKAFVDNVNPVKPDKKYMVIKPLEDFAEGEEPESVLFFVNADQLSALVFLTHFDAPGSMDRVMAPFASACMALVTLPLKLARNNEQKAVMGLFDISARTRTPKDLLSFAMPYAFLKKLAAILPESFITTENWATVKARN
ncbi:MAG TPA: DUF169 domain-containing protein [Prolixibacteraceae bacterium]